MNFISKKFLSSVVGLLVVPSTIGTANASFNTNRELIKGQVATFSKRIADHVENAKNLLDILFSTFLYGLETKRLIIDGIREQDVDSLTDKIYDDDVTRYYLDDEEGKIIENAKFSSRDEAKRFITYCQNCWNSSKCLESYESNEFDEITGFRDFVIRLKATGEAIGLFGYNIERNGLEFFLEINYFVGKNFQGKGYAKEAAMALTKLIFDNIDNGVFKADIHMDNEPSKRLANTIMSYITSDNSANYEKAESYTSNSVIFKLRKIS